MELSQIGNGNAAVVEAAVEEKMETCTHLDRKRSSSSNVASVKIIMIVLLNIEAFTN